MVAATIGTSAMASCMPTQARGPARRGTTRTGVPRVVVRWAGRSGADQRCRDGSRLSVSGERPRGRRQRWSRPGCGTREYLVVAGAPADGVGRWVQRHGFADGALGPRHAAQVGRCRRPPIQCMSHLVLHDGLPLRGPGQLDQQAGEGRGGRVMSGQQEINIWSATSSSVRRTLRFWSSRAFSSSPSMSSVWLFSGWSATALGDDVGNDMTELGQSVSQLAVGSGGDPHRHGMRCQPAAEELIVD